MRGRFCSRVFTPGGKIHEHREPRRCICPSCQRTPARAKKGGPPGPRRAFRVKPRPRRNATLIRKHAFFLQIMRHLEKLVMPREHAPTWPAPRPSPATLSGSSADHPPRRRIPPKRYARLHTVSPVSQRPGPSDIKPGRFGEQQRWMPIPIPIEIWDLRLPRFVRL